MYIFIKNIAKIVFLWYTLKYICTETPKCPERNNFMCGIVGYTGNNMCTEILVEALSKLEYRGYDSAGIAVFEDDKIDEIQD